MKDGQFTNKARSAQIGGDGSQPCANCNTPMSGNYVSCLRCGASYFPTLSQEQRTDLAKDMYKAQMKLDAMKIAAYNEIRAACDTIEDTWEENGVKVKLSISDIEICRDGD